MTQVVKGWDGVMEVLGLSLNVDKKKTFTYKKIKLGHQLYTKLKIVERKGILYSH